MTMQEDTRYERAARALAESGQRVTHDRIDEWLRFHEGRGCSPRDSQPLVVRYRESAMARMTEAVGRASQALDGLNPWERATVLRELRRNR